MFDDFPYHREKALLLKLMFTLKIVDIFYNACFFPSMYIPGKYTLFIYNCSQAH